MSCMIYFLVVKDIRQIVQSGNLLIIGFKNNLEQCIYRYNLME